LQDGGIINISETVLSYITFFGNPIVAVALGLIYSLLFLTKGYSKDATLDELETGIKTSGIILLVTGAGGALGEVLRVSGTGEVIAEYVATWSVPAILIPLFIAIFVRFVQGSGIVAIITAASIAAPIVSNMGLDPVLAAQAAAFGAMVFSYFKDSLFWVVNRMLGIKKIKEQIMVWSVPTTLGWLTAGITLVLIDLIFY